MTTLRTPVCYSMSFWRYKMFHLYFIISVTVILSRLSALPQVLKH